MVAVRNGMLYFQPGINVLTVNCLQDAETIVSY